MLFTKCENFSTAKEIQEMGIYPYFHELQSQQDVEVIMEEQRRIMLGSNNYLGLTANEEVKEAAVAATQKYGSGCSGSRFLNGTLDLHTQLEKNLASFLRKDAALTFSTGYQSNLGIISTICGRGDYIICDKENHASIYDGCRLSFAKFLRYRHSDMEDLEKVLALIPREAGKLIVTDGVFSMSGDICLLPEIVELKQKYNARVMVDDAHGLGVIGEGGRGTASHFGLEDKVDIIMGTFSKSLASLGGYMAASAPVVHFVQHHSRPFIFSASITPASCASALKALEILEKHPQMVDKLTQLAQYMKRELNQRNIKITESPTPIIPIHTRDIVTTLTVAKKLFQAGVYVNPVLPPATPPSDCMLRISLMASHTKELLAEAAEILETVLKETDSV